MTVEKSPQRPVNWCQAYALSSTGQYWPTGAAYDISFLLPYKYLVFYEDEKFRLDLQYN